VFEDFLRVDKLWFGMTGSQWTGLTVSVISVVVLIAWAVRSRERGAGPHGDEPVSEELAA
jgi:hypothetical protein